jgi:hypothetical protein
MCGLAGNWMKSAFDFFRRMPYNVFLLKRVFKIKVTLDEGSQPEGAKLRTEPQTSTDYRGRGNSN